MKPFIWLATAQGKRWSVTMMIFCSLHIDIVCHICETTEVDLYVIFGLVCIHWSSSMTKNCVWGNATSDFVVLFCLDRDNRSFDWIEMMESLKDQDITWTGHTPDVQGDALPRLYSISLNESWWYIRKDVPSCPVDIKRCCAGHRYLGKRAEKIYHFQSSDLPLREGDFGDESIMDNKALCARSDDSGGNQRWLWCEKSSCANQSRRLLCRTRCKVKHFNSLDL